MVVSIKNIVVHITSIRFIIGNNGVASQDVFQVKGKNTPDPIIIQPQTHPFALLLILILQRYPTKDQS